MPFLACQGIALMYKMLHRQRITYERDCDQIRRVAPDRFDRVKFVGLVEDDISGIQRHPCVVRTHGHRSVIYVQEFPEIMGFALEDEVLHIFKIVKCNDRVDLDLFLHSGPDIRHGIPPFVNAHICQHGGRYFPLFCNCSIIRMIKQEG